MPCASSRARISANSFRERIAWPFGLGWVPEFTYWQRPRGTWLWDDAT